MGTRRWEPRKAQVLSSRFLQSPRGNPDLEMDPSSYQLCHFSATPLGKFFNHCHYTSNPHLKRGHTTTSPGQVEHEGR